MMLIEFFRFILGLFVINSPRIMWCHCESDYTLVITVTSFWDVIGLSHWWHIYVFLCVLLFWTFLIIPKLAPGYFGVIFSNPKEYHPASALSIQVPEASKEGNSMQSRVQMWGF